METDVKNKDRNSVNKAPVSLKPSCCVGSADKVDDKRCTISSEVIDSFEESNADISVTASPVTDSTELTSEKSPLYTSRVSFIIDEIMRRSDARCPIRTALNKEKILEMAEKTHNFEESLHDMLYLKHYFPNSDNIYIQNEEDLETFYHFFDELLYILHDGFNKHNIGAGLNLGKVDCYESLDLNENEYYQKVLYCEVIIRRNLNKYPLSGMISLKDRMEIKNLLKLTFTDLLLAFSVCIIPEQWVNRLMEEQRYLHYTKIMRDFPTGRLNIMCRDELDATLGVIINFDDHLQIVASINNGFIGHVYSKMSQMLQSTNVYELEFKTHKEYGYLTVNPKYLGSGLTIRVHLKLPYVALMNDVEPLYLQDLYLSLKTMEHGPKHVLLLSNRRSMYMTEEETFLNIIEGCKRLYQLDLELEQNSSNSVLLFTMPVESLSSLINKMLSFKGSRTYTKRFLTENIINLYSKIVTYYGGQLNHCIRANAFYPHSLFPKASDPDCYSVFSQFFNPIILMANNARQFLHAKQPNYGEANLEKYRLSHPLIERYRVRFSRNLDDFPFQMLMAPSTVEEVEDLMINALNHLAEFVKGSYIKLDKICDHPKYALLTKYNLIPIRIDEIKQACYTYNNWPNNRGLYLADLDPDTPDHILVVLVNEDDHFQVISISISGTRMDICYSKAVHVMKLLTEYFHDAFAKKSTYGYLSSNPQNVGCCMRVSANVKLNNLGNKRNALNTFCINNSFNYRGQNGSGSKVINNVFDISLKFNLNYNESQIVVIFMQRLKDLILEECKYDDTIPKPSTANYSYLKTKFSEDTEDENVDRRMRAISITR